MYCTDSVYSLVANLVKRQEKILKGQLRDTMNTILGINIYPSKDTLDSVPYLLKFDYENSIDVIQDFSDYIVVNITEKDKVRLLIV